VASLSFFGNNLPWQREDR